MVDYSFYEDIYGGNTVPEDSFQATLREAKAILDRLTFCSIVQQGEVYGQIVRGKFQQFTERELMAVKYALCNLLDTVANLDAAEAKALAGNAENGNIHSRSSGGESVTYETVKTAYDIALSDESMKYALYRDAVNAYMPPELFRINPMYAGWG